jgi:hypothetical protein
MMKFYASGGQAAAMLPIAWAGILVGAPAVNAQAVNPPALNPPADSPADSLIVLASAKSPVDSPLLNQPSGRADAVATDVKSAKPKSVPTFLSDRRAVNSGEAKQLMANPVDERPSSVAAAPESDVAPESEEMQRLRQQLLIEPLVQLRAPGFSPGSTAGGPSAFGANFGDAYIGVSGSNRRAKVNEADGSMGLGFGLGDSSKYVGLEVSVNLGSIRKFAANGEVGLKLHRKLSSKSSIAIGYDGGIVWGEENRGRESTLYGVVSQVIPLRPENQDNSMPLTLSLGVGGGRFRSLNDVINQRDSVGVFGSLGLQVAPQASLVSSWTGRDLNLGVSFVPIRTTPLFVTAVAANVLQRDDNATVFSLSLGYGFNFLR